MAKRLIVITHYFKCDKEFLSDYASIDICLPNGELVASWGDNYHDRGQEKAEGFVQGFYWPDTKPEIEYQDVADAEDWGEGCEDND